jgi:sodium-dependent dicarboxylate transporter 2/3/5
VLNIHRLRSRIGLFGVPAAALAVLLFVDLDPARPEITRMAAVALLMAGWWITEAIPIPATSLLPVALFPLLGILDGKVTAGLYFNDTIFLFIGGFIFALAMQKWNLHRRIALRIILILGSGPMRLLLGFMVATWFLSMWISNTATTMMMVPMAMAIILQLREQFGAEKVSNYSVGLLLGVAYSASIGGIATIIGTPPNLSFRRIFTILFPRAPEISFADWFIFALPLSVVFLLICWGLLGRLFARNTGIDRHNTDMFHREYDKLGPMGFEERAVSVLFGLLVFLWMFRRDLFLIPGWSRLLPDPELVYDGTAAIVVAIILFLVPSRSQPGERLMDWETAVKLKWGIVLLFGGGFALAGGFAESGLSTWLGEHLSDFADYPPLVLILVTCMSITFLTELTSNAATTEMALPVLGSLAVAIDVNPLLLMVPATLSASCAFMLPVATPPNAIAFGSGELPMRQMVRTGIVLNLIGVVLVTAAIYLLGLAALGIDLAVMPDWAVTP